MPLPPGPRAPMVVQTASFLRRPFRFMQRCHDRYGDMFSVRLGFTGPARGLVVGSSALIREVFRADSGALSGGQGNEPLRPVMGDHSVGLLDGDAHARQRRLLMPPFHGERMRAYAETMRDATARHLARWPGGKPFALLPRLLAIALEIILRTVFGMDGAELAETETQLRRLLAVLANPMVLMVPALQRDLGPLTPWRRFLRERAATDALLHRRIAQARAESSADREDILSLLLHAVDEQGSPLTDEELRDQLVTLLLAGHETSATSIAWVFDRLLANPHALAEVKREIADVLGGGPLRAEHLPQLELLEAAIREALRLRPAAPGAFRKTTRPVVIGGQEIPPGTVVMASSYLAHRQKDVYPDPERFDARRFLGAKPDPHAWIPFGGGSRRCIGMAYATYEMKVVCATMLSSLDLALADGPADVTCRAVFHSPTGGLRVLLAKRFTASA
ncbi:MAG: cytochrome P450 [Polyangiaceae bacterium]